MFLLSLFFSDVFLVKTAATGHQDFVLESGTGMYYPRGQLIQSVGYLVK